MAKQTFTTGQVLSAAQMTSLQQTAMLGGASNARVASYVLVAADAGDAITMNSASPTTITVNNGLFAAGDIVTIINTGAGACTITAGTATVTTSGSLVLGQNQGGVLRFTSATAAIFLQFMTPVSAGGMTLIASINASAATSLSFTSIPSTFKHLLVTVSGTQDTTNVGWGVRFNNNSGSDYSQSGIFYQGPTTPIFQVTENWNTNGFGLSTSSQRGVILAYQGTPYGNSTSEMWIFDYTDTANQKVVRWNAYGSRESGGGAYSAYCHHQGVYEQLSAVSQIDFIRQSSQTFTGIVRLYGVS